MRIQWSVFILGIVLATHTGVVAFADGQPTSGSASTAGWEQTGSQGDPTSYFTNSLQPMYNGQPPQPPPSAEGGYGEYYGPQDGGAGYPPGSQPYPAISPYENSFQQLHRNQGLWYQDSSNETRQWNAGIEMLLFNLMPPRYHQIGFPLINEDPQLNFVRDTGAIRDYFDGKGVRPFVGYFDADGSGAELSGMYIQPVNETQAFIDRPLPAIIAREILPSQAVPFPSESPNPLIFDTAVYMQYAIQLYGMEGNYYTTPVLGQGANKIRVSYGVRYFNLKESMSVLAIDSFNGQTEIDSIIRTNLVGPQAGLRWDMGGKILKIVSYGKLGVLADLQRQELNAQNYGGLNFAIQEQHGYVSPMLDFGIRGEMPLFAYLPFFKKIAYVNKAIFKVGVDWTGIFNIQRPAQQVVYGDPVLQIQKDRSPRFDMYGVRLGWEWRW